MTSTAHALVAGAIATSFPQMGIYLPLCYLSHFVLDSIPHWDFGTNWRNRPKRITAFYAIAETLFGIGVSYAIYGKNLPFLAWVLAVSAALLPDWLETPWYIFFAHHKKLHPAQDAGVLEKIAFSFYKIPNYFHNKAQPPLGIITQVLTVGFFIFLLE